MRNKWLVAVVLGAVFSVMTVARTPAGVAQVKPPRGAADVVIDAKKFKPSAEVTKVEASAARAGTKGIAGQLITVQDMTSGATHQLSASKDHRIGQSVFRNLNGEVALAGFPIRKQARDNIGPSSRKMETEVVISKSGSLDAKTRTWTAEAARGFHGAVVVLLTDANGNRLWRSREHTYGVNGTAIPGSGSSVTRSWTEQIPAADLDQAASCVIIHAEHPTSTIFKTLDDAVKLLDWINANKDKVQTIIELGTLIGA